MNIEAIDQLREKIFEAVELKQWLKLEKHSQEWIRVAPNSPSAFKWLARASVAQEKWERAHYAYNRVLDLEKNNQEAIEFLQDFPSPSQNNYPVKQTAPGGTQKKSSDHLSWEEKQKLANAEFECGKVYENLKLFANAAERYKAAFLWRPEADSALAVGRALMKAERHFDANKFVKEQLHQNPSWIEGRLLLASLHRELGQMTSAQKEWQNVLKLDGENKEAINGLRGIY